MYKERFKVKKTNLTPEHRLQLLNDSTEVATLTQPALNNSHGMYCPEGSGLVKGQHLRKTSEYPTLREKLHCLYLCQEFN